MPVSIFGCPPQGVQHITIRLHNFFLVIKSSIPWWHRTTGYFSAVASRKINGSFHVGFNSRFDDASEIMSDHAVVLVKPHHVVASVPGTLSAVITGCLGGWAKRPSAEHQGPALALTWVSSELPPEDRSAMW